MSISKRLRFEIFRRDGYACVYCGRRTPSITLEVDHRLPRCMGGSDDPSNLVSACWDCNRGKGPLLPDDEYAEERLSDREENRALEQFYLDEGGWPDELPKWMLPPRERYHINLGFDILAAARELPKAETVTILQPWEIFRMASIFDPFSEVGCEA